MICNPASYCKAVGSECLELHIALNYLVFEECHNIVRHHNESERGFSSVKLLEAEVVRPKILLEFFDPVFAVRSGIVDVADLIHRQGGLVT